MLAVKLIFILIFVCYYTEAEENVVQYDDTNFLSKISEKNLTLVMFYAPWCGHCKQLKPVFELAAGKLKKNRPPIILAKVDCTDSGQDTCSRYSVGGYPALKIFKDGEYSKDYDGARTASGIVKYMRYQTYEKSKELKSEEDLKEFLSASEVSVIGFFKSNDSLKDTFNETSEKLFDKIRFAYTFNDDIAQKYNVNNNVILFRPKFLHNKFEEDYVKYSGEINSEKLNDFITKNIFGLVGYRHGFNSEEFKNPLVVAYYNVDYEKNTKGTNYWRNRIIKVAKDFVDVFNFAISSKNEFQTDFDNFGIENFRNEYLDGDKPIILAKDIENKKYIMNDKFTPETFKQFLIDLKSGKLQPLLKSEPIPEDNEGPVKIAVGKNFDQVVYNNSKDTLIEFYAPWCGHCKNLAPIYEKLATKLKNEDVDIVKMDATSNDVPPLYKVEGFPTIYWVPKNKKDSPVPYNDGRKLDDFIKFIAKYATDELKGYDRNGKIRKTEL